MPFTTYAELQTEVGNWINRADMAEKIPDWISLAESRVNADLKLNSAEFDVDLTGVIDSRFIPLPLSFSQPLALWWNNGVGREAVRFVSADQIDNMVWPARPLYWTIDGTNIAFERPCDKAYSFTLRCLEKLNIAVAVNSLLTDFPLVYLAGALVEGFAYLADVEAGRVWEARYKQALQQAMDQSNASRKLATLSVDPALRRPRRFNINTGD